MKSLSSSEWTLLAIFFMLFASFVFVAKVSAYRAADTIGKLNTSKVEFLVTVNGAVKKPGEFRVEEGTPLSAVIKKARPLPFADLKAIPLKKMVLSPLQIDVPELSEVRVSVSGEIAEPLEISMPVGSRIKDLKGKVSMTPETDNLFFRRKKLLRDGDKIVVPKKTVEQN